MKVGFTECRGEMIKGWRFDIKLLDNRAPVSVTELRRDRDSETVKGKISETERGRPKERRVSFSAFLSEAGHIILLHNELNHVLGLINIPLCGVNFTLMTHFS